MKNDHRICNSLGQRMKFTCINSGYGTNLLKGEPHSPFSETCGSVFPEPLIQHSGNSLWLEHIVELKTGTELYWLMWYDEEGKPIIPLSGVFDRTELRTMISRLVEFIP